MSKGHVDNGVTWSGEAVRVIRNWPEPDTWDNETTPRFTYGLRRMRWLHKSRPAYLTMWFARGPDVVGGPVTYYCRSQKAARLFGEDFVKQFSR